jgi:hypothetical protein
VVSVGNEGYVAAPAAIAAAGTAPGHKLLTPEGEAAIASVASLYGNDDFVDKHRNSQKKEGQKIKRRDIPGKENSAAKRKEKGPALESQPILKPDKRP